MNRGVSTFGLTRPAVTPELPPLDEEMGALTELLLGLREALAHGAPREALQPAEGPPGTRGLPYMLEAVRQHFSGPLYYHQEAEDARAAARAAMVARREAHIARLDYVGAREPPRRWNLLGWRARDERPFALTREGGQVVAVVGSLGAGKSQALLAAFDALFAPTPGLTSQTLPRTAGLSLLCAPGELVVPDLLYAAQPNPRSADCALLRERLGVEPAGLGEIRLLVPQSERDAVYGHLREVLPDALRRRLHLGRLALPPAALGQLGLEALLGADPDGPPGYLLDVLAKAQELGDDLSARRLQELVDGEEGLSRVQKALARGRIAALGAVLDERADVGMILEPGALTIAGLYGRWLRRAAALPLGMVVLNAALAPSPHGPLQRFFGLDELDALPDDPLLWGVLSRIIRQMRHRGGNLWLSGQDLLRLPPELFGLVTQFLCFRLRSPRLFGLLRERIAGLLGIHFSAVSDLPPGQALWVPTECTDPAWAGRAALVRLRPPLCMHGGHTKAVR